MEYLVGVALGVFAYRSLPLGTDTADDGAPLPKYFCWHPSLLVPIRNQSSCSACWAFSICDMVADAISVRTGGQWRKHLSPQYLLDCTESFGCATGGIPEDVYDLPQVTDKDKGIPLEQNYPYEKKIDGCKIAVAGERVRLLPNTYRSLCVDPDNYSGAARQDCIEKNMRRMKRAIMTNGPIVGTIIAREDFIHYNAKAKKDVYKSDPTSPVVGGHAICIVGWCEESVNWKGEFDDAYYIIRSSYGGKWGLPQNSPSDYGFVYVKMGTNESGIESRASVCDVLIPESAKSLVVDDPIKVSAVIDFDNNVEDPERTRYMNMLK